MKRVRRVWNPFRLAGHFLKARALGREHGGKPLAAFMQSFRPKKVNGLFLRMESSFHEANVALSLGNPEERGYYSPYNEFQAKFKLTSGIEENIHEQLRTYFPQARAGTICYVEAIESPAKIFDVTGPLFEHNPNFKGPASRISFFHPVALPEQVRQLNAALNEPWANFLLRELIEHARKQGLAGIALLRPEHNEHIVGLEADRAKTVQTMNKLYFSAARANGLKKVNGSKYLWLLFEKSGS